MIIGQDLSISLGRPVLITGFADGEARYCYPYVLGELDEIGTYFNAIDCNDYRNNVKDEMKMQIIASIFIRSFHLKEDELGEFLLSAINSENYPLIIADIKRISGINDNSQEEVKDSNNEDTSINWDVAFGEIATRTGYTYKEISELTLSQFNNVMKAIGKDINWDYKVATIGMAKEPDNHISDEEHPLYNDKKNTTIVDGKRVTTMKDLQGLLQD